MPHNNQNLELNILIGIIAALFALLLLIILVMHFKDFFKELNYLNCEIERTEGSERRYWKRQKRKLWLSLIPFVKY